MEFEPTFCTFSEYDEDGFLGVQTDGLGEGAGHPPGELLTPMGIGCRPLDPERGDDGELDPARATQALRMTFGSRTWVLPLFDPRAAEKLPQFGKGLTWLSCPATGAYAVFDGEKGSFYLYVPYAHGDKAMALLIDVETPGSEVVRLIHGSGVALLLEPDKAVLKNASGDAHLEVNADGIVLNGNVTTTGSTVGGRVESAEPVALARPLVTLLGAMATKLSALGAALTPDDLRALTEIPAKETLGT